MKVASFEAIVRALNDGGVRYLVVGGLAVNAHGYLRFTKDVDLVIRLQTADIVAAFSALGDIGYQPSVPITAEQFADAEMREGWRRDKEMLVLKMWSDLHRETPVDIFVYEPFDFDREYERALTGNGQGDPPARFIGIPALIRMKEVAGRDSDLIDIGKLRQIAALQGLQLE
jgi:hypothetical protein